MKSIRNTSTYLGLPRLTSALLGTSRSAQVARHKSLGTSSQWVTLGDAKSERPATKRAIRN
ncbi:hypothetical protein LC613_15200 [Nostoc sphaeroides CHAB 2801]|uniref:hypothetical protein n=1 Tax=Nostoc sphaeroides TaxID=446679 RepID=UPI0011C14CFD|nr:hypothetical protein [Nostoc sphaeroides]MCC5629342.1 hypothetical protein [Nostoc sphaeroides CHAB 2801]